MARLPLNTLPAFRAVARLQNMRAAAAALHVTHSAISQQIKLLEEQSGLALFERRGRGVQLNAAGSALLRAVEPALDRLAEGLREAQALVSGSQQHLRLTVLPSFAQRWLLPRIGRWRERHPGITLEVHASQQVMDLQVDGFHAAIRAGSGTWRGVQAERLIDSVSVVVAAPQRAARLANATVQQLAAEPLLGEAEQWARWLALSGVRLVAQPVADFNDAGLMLQATELDLGITLVQEVPAADALQAGRLVRLSPLALHDAGSDATTYWFVHATENAEWPPLAALRRWLHDEMALSREALDALQARRAADEPPVAGVPPRP